MPVSAYSLFKLCFYRVIAVCCLSCGCLNFAFAAVGDAFVKTLQSSAQSYGFSLHYQNIQTQNNTVILQNAQLRQTADPAALPIDLGTVAFNTIQMQGDGTFTVAAITATGSNAANMAAETGSGNAVRIVLQDMQMQNARIRPQNNAGALSADMPYQNFSLKNIAYSIGGRNILKLDDINMNYTEISSENGHHIFKNATKIAAFTYNPAAWLTAESKETAALLQALGYSSIRGSVSATGAWNPQSGDLNINEYKIAGDSMGTITLSGKLTGLTQAFSDRYQNIIAKQAGNNIITPEQRQEISNLASQLHFSEFSVYYTDNSLTGRVLDYFSRLSTLPRQQIVSVIKAGIFQNMQSYKDKAFAHYAMKQIGAFLDNPKTLRITARPLQPVAFSSILSALNASPEQFIKLLALNIIANQ